MHNPIETEDATGEEERKGRGLYIQDNQQYSRKETGKWEADLSGSRENSKSRERPGECRKSREEEKPVFEEDPDEEEIYNAEKDVGGHETPAPLWPQLLI